MKFKLFSADGSSFEEVKVDNFPVIDDGKQAMRALKDTLIAYMANNRQGNSSTKTRAQVSGTGKKPWRQKGTGNARHGSRRSPIWVGGGVAHGPKDRDFSQKINKKVKLLALRQAMADAARENSIILIKKLSLKEPKTAMLQSILKNFNIEGTVLFVDSCLEENIILAGRNHQNVFMINSDSLNAWDIVRYDNIVIAENALNALLNNRINKKG